MPFGEPHQRQKRKNIAVLIALLALMAILFAVTLIKFSPAVSGG